MGREGEGGRGMEREGRREDLRVLFFRNGLRVRKSLSQTQYSP